MRPTTILAALICFTAFTPIVIAQSEAPSETANVTKAKPSDFVGSFQMIDAVQTLVIKDLGDGKFSVTCEDWEATLFWAKNTNGLSGVFKYLDKPKVETNPDFHKGGVAENGVGFLQISWIKMNVFEVRGRWSLADSDKSWAYKVAKKD